jgi:hypothetical protein
VKGIEPWYSAWKAACSGPPSRKYKVNPEIPDTKFRPRLCGRNRSMLSACRRARSFRMAGFLSWLLWRRPRQSTRSCYWRCLETCGESSSDSESEIAHTRRWKKSLRAARAAGIIGADVFTGKVVRGRVPPMNKKAWAAKLKKYAVLAGVNEPKKSCHGLRKARAEVAAYADCTESQMMAMFGWTDPKMPTHYTRRTGRSSTSAAWRRSWRSMSANHSMISCQRRKRTAREQPA